MEYLILLCVSFISATLFPMGSEGFLIYYTSIGLNIYLLVLLATFGNTLGSYVNYWLGLKGEKYLVEKKYLKEKKLKRAKSFFDKYGGYSLFLSWAPIIGDAITFIAGILKYDVKKFFLIVSIAKLGRYIFVVVVYLYFQ